MRRVILSLVVALLACANTGCLAVVATETLEASTKRVAVVDGQMYVVNLETNTAKPVRMVKRCEIITEDALETTTEVTINETQP